MGRRQKSKEELIDRAYKNFRDGYGLISRHPLFSPLMSHVNICRNERSICPDDGWAVVTNNGDIYLHPRRRVEAQEWVYILAHCLLHLAFGHFQKKEKPVEWNTACDCFITKFLSNLKLGVPPEELRYDAEFSASNEEKLYQFFCLNGIPEHLKGFGTGGKNRGDIIIEPVKTYWRGTGIDWQLYFSQGLSMAVTSAVNVAGGKEPFLGGGPQNFSPAVKAKEWFISSYPLLGALAASFDIVEEQLVCHRMEISIGAVDDETKEIFINPAAGMGEEECRFVIAHELLHVGLRHSTRRQGREPYLWNVACDYVINLWLVEMGLGELPRLGALYDPELKNFSAEAVYDRIVTDIRKYKKLATLRGVGLCDILDRGLVDWWKSIDGMRLDDFYRECLSQGLMYHEEQGRGFLPGNLIEEIRSLSYPPIPWDVELAQWFDNYFTPLEKRRSYARPSRRQSSTPHIPRPSYVPSAGSDDGRTFGVILDTSGSMERNLLAKALGAIASYSISRDVPAVRVIFCDTVPYDEGYMLPEAIAGKVKVKGRGGTALQSAIDLLEKAEDFPKEGPLLIITDGACDRLIIRRVHAFLMPEGRHLPFVAKGKIFRIK